MTYITLRKFFKNTRTQNKHEVLVHLNQSTRASYKLFHISVRVLRLMDVV